MYRISPLQFISHDISHSRNRRILAFLKKNHYNVYISKTVGRDPALLGMKISSARRLLSLFLESKTSRYPLHLDGISVFSFLRPPASNFLIDFRCPLPEELEWLGQPLLAKYSGVLLKHLLTKAKVVISPNYQMVEYAKQWYHGRNTIVIPNYPPHSFQVNISQEEARRQLGMDSTQHIALFIGSTRLREIYGLELLLRTWSQIVSKKMPGAILFITGSLERISLDDSLRKRLETKGVHFVGRVDHSSIPLWIKAADVCLTQRTPGFPSKYYNHLDSLKMSEYAALEKPIVAAGYQDTNQYISTKTNAQDYGAGIIEAFRGNAPKATPHFWEENYPLLREAYALLLES